MNNWLMDKDSSYNSIRKSITADRYNLLTYNIKGEHQCLI
jgi:hypothetical protein